MERHTRQNTSHSSPGRSRPFAKRGGVAHVGPSDTWAVSTYPCWCDGTICELVTVRTPEDLARILPPKRAKNWQKMLEQSGEAQQFLYWPGMELGEPHPRSPIDRGEDTMTGDVSVEVKKWTPDDAAKALAKNHVNRNIRERKVVQYMRDMKEGRWTFCPDPITFNSDGDLINGQHRLTAQIRAGADIEWIVVREVDNEVQATMDTGASRSLGDMLTFEGANNTATLAAITRLAHAMTTGRIYSEKTDSQASPKELLEFYRGHQDLNHSNQTALDAARSGVVSVPPSALGGAHWWIMQHAGVEEADNFIGRIGSLVGERDGSPVIALVKRLNEIARAKIRVKPRWIIYVVLKAYNHDVRGVETQKIALTTRDGNYRLLTPLKRGISLSQEEMLDTDE